MIERHFLLVPKKKEKIAILWIKRSHKSPYLDNEFLFVAITGQESFLKIYFIVRSIAKHLGDFGLSKKKWQKPFNSKCIFIWYSTLPYKNHYLISQSKCIYVMGHEIHHNQKEFLTSTNYNIVCFMIMDEKWMMKDNFHLCSMRYLFI
jgi:hypothetical protein